LKEQHQRKEGLSFDLCAINTYKTRSLYHRGYHYQQSDTPLELRYIV